MSTICTWEPTRVDFGYPKILHIWKIHAKRIVFQLPTRPNKNQDSLQNAQMHIWLLEGVKMRIPSILKQLGQFESSKKLRMRFQLSTNIEGKIYQLIISSSHKGCVLNKETNCRIGDHAFLPRQNYKTLAIDYQDFTTHSYRASKCILHCAFDTSGKCRILE